MGVRSDAHAPAVRQHAPFCMKQGARQCLTCVGAWDARGPGHDGGHSERCRVPRHLCKRSQLPHVELRACGAATSVKLFAPRLEHAVLDRTAQVAKRGQQRECKQAIVAAVVKDGPRKWRSVFDEWCRGTERVVW